MNNFRRPNSRKSTKKINTIDGFLPDKGVDDSADVRKKFSKTYQPKSTPVRPRSDTRSFESVSRREEDLDLDGKDFEKNQFDEQVPDKQKNRFFKKKDKKKKQGLRKKLARGFAVSFIALVLAVGSLFAYGYLKTRQIFRGNGEGAAALEENVDPSRLNGEGDGRVNILLLGKGGPGHTAPDLTDTILLASIDPVQNEAALLSIPRDLYVEDPAGQSSKINAVYANAKQSQLYEDSEDTDAAEDAGLRSLKQTVSDTIGVPIHYYVMVDFEAFEQSINTVGGITIDVKEPLYDSTMAWLNNGNPLLADEGLQTFDGKRALYYARSRHGSSRGDFDRTERQREVIIALQQKVLSLGTFSNPFKMVELLNTFGDNVRTDLNGTSELKRLYEIGQNIGAERVTSVGLADPPNILVTTDFVANQSVVVPVAGLYQYDEIQDYIRNTLRDPYLKQEDARIVILNGTTTGGLATAREKELKSYGYNVVSVDNAPTSDYETTMIIDLNSGEKRYTKSYLERRLGKNVVTEYIDGIPTIETADFVIILGRDEAFKTTSN